MCTPFRVLIFKHLQFVFEPLQFVFEPLQFLFQTFNHFVFVSGVLYDKDVDSPEVLTAFRLAVRNHNRESFFNFTEVAKQVKYTNTLDLSIASKILYTILYYYGFH